MKHEPPITRTKELTEKSIRRPDLYKGKAGGGGGGVGGRNHFYLTQEEARSVLAIISTGLCPPVTNNSGK